MSKFKSKKPNSSHAINSLKYPIKYKPSYFGFEQIKGTGKNVNICIIDSGCPIHKDLKKKNNIINSIDFTNDNSETVIDNHGHSTAICGVLQPNNIKNIVGICPDANIYIAKAINDHGYGSCDAVIASILWSVIKKVDIILMPFGFKFDNPILHNAIIKAFNSNILLISANGNDNEIMYPAFYNEVLSVGFLEKFKDKKYNINIKDFDYVYTLFKKDKYIKMKGSSFCAAGVAGVAALIIEQIKNKDRQVKNPNEIYDIILKHYNK